MQNDPLFDNFYLVGGTALSLQIGHRVSEDIYFLLQYLPFEKMVDNFKKRNETDNILHYLRSVMYFDDIKKESWDNIKYLKNKISEKVIMERLTKEVLTFARNDLNLTSI